MKKFLSVLMILGIVFLTVPKTIFAVEPTPTPIPYTTTLSIAADQYISFGDANYPYDIANGIQLSVDLESTATYWINLFFDCNQQIIIDRNISKFYVLANGKIIDTIYVEHKDSDNNGTVEPVPQYMVKPESWGLAGGDVNFQIVGVQLNQYDVAIGNQIFDAEMVVAWSRITETIQMDPVKTNDAEAISVLYQILNKLNELLSALSGKLDSIKDELQTLFTPSPEAESRLNSAMDNLLKSTPMGDMNEKSNQMKNMFDNTLLDQPMERLTFGDKKDWFKIGMEFYLIDLTELQDQIELIRNLLAAIIWIEFFVWLVFYLSPKLNL